MKKIFNKLLIPVTASLAILPIANCSKNEKKQIYSIEFTSNIDDVTLIQNQEFISKPLEAKCFDQDKQEKYMFIDFDIKVKGFENKPGWISLTSKNEIKISNLNDIADYEISVVAFNEEEKLYSQPLTFNLKVINERHIMPDSISIEIENNRYCMFGEETIIPINIIPFKQDTEEKYLLKECSISIEALKSNELFQIGGTDLNPTLIVSRDTAKSDIGSYSLTITARLLENPDIFVTKQITINIDNIYYQFNDQCRCAFTRSSAHENWTLAQADSDLQTISNIPTMIQNRPVTKVTQNFCQRSEINRLVQIILPPTIVMIGANAFANQRTLCSIEMPGVKYVCDSAFANDSLLELRLHGEKPSFYYLGNRAFYGCGEKDFGVQKDLIWIGDYAFKNAGLRQFEIGEDCCFIGCESFSNCSNLSSFKIWAKIPPQIGGANFDKCDQLSSIKVPSENLGDYMLNQQWSNLGKTIEGFQ